MTKQEFFENVLEPMESQLDAHELHLRRLYEANQSARLFAATGIDFSGIITGPEKHYGVIIKNPTGPGPTYFLD